MFDGVGTWARPKVNSKGYRSPHPWNAACLFSCDLRSRLVSHVEFVYRRVDVRSREATSSATQSLRYVVSHKCHPRKYKCIVWRYWTVCATFDIFLSVRSHDSCLGDNTKQAVSTLVEAFKGGTSTTLITTEIPDSLLFGFQILS